MISSVAFLLIWLRPVIPPWLSLTLSHLLLVVAWALTAVVLYFSAGLHRVLGAKTLVAVERLMGMVLVIIATQMTLDGISRFFALTS